MVILGVWLRWNQTDVYEALVSKEDRLREYEKMCFKWWVNY